MCRSVFQCTTLCMFQICYFLVPLLRIKFSAKILTWAHARNALEPALEESLSTRKFPPENFNYAPADDSQSRRKERGNRKIFHGATGVKLFADRQTGNRGRAPRCSPGKCCSSLSVNNYYSHKRRFVRSV